MENPKIEWLNPDSRVAKALEEKNRYESRVQRRLRTVTRWVPLPRLASRCGCSEAELLQYATRGALEVATTNDRGEWRFLAADTCGQLLKAPDGALNLGESTRGAPMILYRLPRHRGVVNSIDPNRGMRKPETLPGKWRLTTNSIYVMPAEAERFLRWSQQRTNGAPQNNQGKAPGGLKEGGRAARERQKPIRKLAEEYVNRYGWPGLNALAKQLKCSPSGLSRAVQKSTLLKARKALHEEPPKAREEPMTDAVAEGAEQTREADPAETLEELKAEQAGELRREDRQAQRAARRRDD